MCNLLPDFLVETALGYYCSYGDFYIDPKQPVDKALISHAHGDHAVPGHRQIFCTFPTAAFMKHRFTKQLDETYCMLNFNTTISFQDVSVTFIPAGHILGSSQLLMEYKGVKYLYTGDYKLQRDLTCEPIQIVQADVLITETTFANPKVIHPDPVEEIKKLNAISCNIMLGCYTLGKAQRLTNLMNSYCPKKTVYVHHNMLPIHKLYNEYGLVKLDYEIYNRKSLKDGIDKVYLVPPITFNNYFRAKNVVRAFASGWEGLQKYNDISLYISDHIDWNDLLTFIEKVKPTQIWTVHGDGALLKAHFDGRLSVRRLRDFKA